MPSEQISQRTHIILRKISSVSKLQPRAMLEELIQDKYKELVNDKKMKEI
tara:strand:- start:496 stop:645 length:150 start_codon:yes stop_codon:yes gene_type:complete